MFRSALALSLLLAPSLLAPTLALAGGTSDEAEVNFVLGAAAFERGELQEALAYFLASNRLAPNANVMFNVARTFEEQGQFAEAFRWYADAAALGDAATRADAERAMADLGPRVARADIVSDPPGASIFVDRPELGSVGLSPRPLALPAGSHDFLLEKEGYRPQWVRGAELVKGGSTPIQVKLEPLRGQVRVEGAEGLSAFVDEASEAACAVPCTLSLTPGLHTVRLRSDGYRSLPVQVQVIADSDSVVRPEVVAITGAVVISAEEQGALIEIDGRTAGFTPAALELPVGTRTVRVSRPGFEPVERTVEVLEGGQIELRDLPMRASRDVEAASRYREPIEQAPSSITVISGTELRAFGYPHIYEALRGTRGTALSTDSTYSSIAVRGLGQANDFGNRLLILQDGATLNDNILWQSFIGYDGRVDLGDVERIEVVRGAGSVLYGTGAVSGVVNLVTRAKEEEAGVSASVATYDNGVARARVGAKLGDADRGAWVSAAAARSPGREDSVTLGGEELVFEGVDRFQAGTVNARGWAGVFSAQALYTRRDQVIPTGPYGTVRNETSHVWIDQRALMEVKAEPELSDTLRILARAYANLYVFDGNLPYEGEEEGSLIPSVERYTGRWGGAEARVAWQKSESLRASAGVETQYSITASLDGKSVYEDGTEEVYLDEARPYGLVAAYGVLDGAPNDLLRYSLGGRVDYWTTTGPTFNPRLALILTPGEANILKVMGGRSFRAPSTYEIAYNDGGYSQIPSDALGGSLDPEVTWSGELEYTRKLDEDWSLLGSVYSSHTQGLVETLNSDPEDPDSPVIYSNSAVPALVVGADTELRRDLRRGWMFTAQGGVMRAQYLDETANLLANAPPAFASVKLIAPIAEPAARLAFRSTLEAPRVIVPGSARRTDPAVITDLVLSGRSRTGAVEYSVGSYNLFDWRYSQPLAGTFDFDTMPQAGRSFMANVTLRN